MDATLGRLLLLRFRGGIRQRLKQFATLRGFLFLLITVGIVWLLIVSRSSPVAEDYGGSLLTQNPGLLREHLSNLMPPALLGLCLLTALTASGPALYFSPAEVNFLFAGPFSRRGLVIYKVCAYAAGAVLSASIIALLIPPHTSAGGAAFIGSFLTLLFIQLCSTVIGMSGQVLAGAWFARARGPALLLGVALISASLVYIFVGGDKNILGGISDFRQSWPGTIILAPFSVFAELFLAPAIFPDLLMWASVAIAINLGLLLAVVHLDGRSLDESLSASRRLDKRWLRIKQGGSIWATEKTSARSLRRAPSLGGVGAVAWRQMINALRNSTRAILVLLIISLIAGPLLINSGPQFTLWGRVGLLFFFALFILPRTLVFDFRGELGIMEYYKALPIGPWRICAGQLVVPVILTSIIELVLLCGILPFVDGTATIVVATLTIFTVPFNLLLYGIENLIFLMFPTRLVPVGRVDFDFFGRTFVEFMIKTIILSAACGLAIGVGLTVLQATGHSRLLFVLASWLTLLIVALSVLPLLGFAFRRFNINHAIE